MDNCDESQELLSLMKLKLPGYVTKCFLASGFDSEEAIASMDVTINGPENSIKIMEAYIEKHFSHDPSMHSVFSFDHGMPFEFPPGHKVRICSFVKEVKQNYNRKISQFLTVQPCHQHKFSHRRDHVHTAKKGQYH